MKPWTEETLAKIRELYREYTDPRGGGEFVNLQGLVFDTNQADARRSNATSPRRS